MPALNELLEPFGAALGDMVLEGQLPALGGDTPWYASGANIVKWPAGGWLHSAVLTDKASEGDTYTLASIAPPPSLSLSPPLNKASQMDIPSTATPSGLVAFMQSMRCHVVPANGAFYKDCDGEALLKDMGPVGGHTTLFTCTIFCKP